MASTLTVTGSAASSEWPGYPRRPAPSPDPARAPDVGHTEAVLIPAPVKRVQGARASERRARAAETGATCEFSATIAFGIGEPEPNTFTCRKPSGEVMSEGCVAGAAHPAERL